MPRRWSLRGGLLLAAAPLLLAATATPDPLVEGFRAPPPSARPRLWWHWMNGNVDAAGARLDLDWMASIGIGGVQVFEAGMGAPQVVPERRVFLSPEWRRAFADSAAHARSLGLDFGIATSPGWSATGGPWVSPRDAMKKLVWSETIVSGGTRLTGRLAPPPTATGPYQDIPAAAVEGDAPVHPPEASGEARVLAFPAPAAPDPAPIRLIADGSLPDPAMLRDGRFGAAHELKAADGAAWLTLEYGRAVTIRSAIVGLPGLRGFGTPKPPLAFLDASDDGARFRRIATLPPTSAPVRSAGFAPVRARYFRLRIAPDPAPGFNDTLSFAPGAVRPPFGGKPATAYALSEMRLSAAPRVAAAEEKAGFATLPDYFAAPSAPATGIAPRSVIDLTDRLRPDGRVDWTPPPGRWTILRLGWSLTGHRNGPAPEEATGLEVDKLDPARVAAYIDHYLDLYRDAAGADRAIGALLSDSIEAGTQTWTEGLPAAFRARRGYDPTPWLPALTGAIVGDDRRTERFLWDWRRTIADLYAEAHYGTIAAAARRRGMVYYAEALEDHRPQLGDDMAMRAVADVPMAAMWTLAPGAAPNPTYVADIKGAASVANLYGKPLVAAESLTAFGHPWAYAPADLKRTVDLEFALGVNRLMIHTSAHQPRPDMAPGLALAQFLGQYFARTETWAPFAGTWIDYLSRTSFLMQQGRHVADVAYFYGEEAPLTALFGDKAAEGVPSGFDHDFVNGAALARLMVRDGRLQTAEGQSYRVLLLGGSSRYLTLATLRRLEALAAAGATIVGDRPLGSPSLADDDDLVAAAIARLWSAGLIQPGRDAGAALHRLGLPPDWAWAGDGMQPGVIYRATADANIYFVTNQSGAPMHGTLTLRVAGRVPERWDAMTGEISPLSFAATAGRTSVPLSLASDDAAILVFRKPTAETAATIAPPRETLVRALSDWTLRFQPGRGAPAETMPSDLAPWDGASLPGIRYFSGIGTYRAALPLAEAPKPGERLVLDLGAVAELAEVSVNGRRAGIAWRAPFRVDVTGLLHRGANRVEVRVANLWVNRLIGDQQPGAVKIAQITGPTYAADAPLRRSGLLGPVRLIALDR